MLQYINQNGFHVFFLYRLSKSIDDIVGRIDLGLTFFLLLILLICYDM